jgi:hypothetical protein
MPQLNRSPSASLPTSDELLAKLNNERRGLYTDLVRMRQEGDNISKPSGGFRGYLASKDEPSNLNYPSTSPRRFQQSGGGGGDSQGNISYDQVQKILDKFKNQGGQTGTQMPATEYSIDPAAGEIAPADTGYLYTYTGAPEVVPATEYGGIYEGIGGVGAESGAGAEMGTVAGGTEAGGGAGAGAAGGGLGAMGIGAIIAAAIAGQHALSDDTDKKFEGVKTDDAFSGHFGTEPWLAWATPKHATAGEQFDASVAQGDWDTAGKRGFGMADYWSDPARGALGEFGEEYLGSTGKWLLNPMGAALQKIGDL